MSTKTIWKFPLALVDAYPVDMPRGARILSVADQNGTLCLWAEVDPEAPCETRRIRIVGSGHPVPQEPKLQFIGTAVQGPFVWHVYEAAR